MTTEPDAEPQAAAETVEPEAAAEDPSRAADADDAADTRRRRAAGRRDRGHRSAQRWRASPRWRMWRRGADRGAAQAVAPSNALIATITAPASETAANEVTKRVLNKRERRIARPINSSVTTTSAVSSAAW